MTTRHDAIALAAGPAKLRDDSLSFVVGVVALLIAGLQPLVLGGLATEGRLSTPQIGIAATVELLALGLSCGLAAALVKPQAIRLKMMLTCLAHAGANLACVWLAGAGLIVARGVAGGLAGLMLWMTISMIARSAKPERYAGIFFTAQTLAQLAIAGLAPLLIVPRFGINGVLICLACLSALAALAAAFGPDRFTSLTESAGGKIGLRPMLGLAAIFLFLAFIVSVWVYLEPLATRAGLSVKSADEAIAIALGCQVVGAGVATVVGDRVSAVKALIGVAVLDAVILAVLWSAPGPSLFMVSVASFGFLWMFAAPFQTLLLIQLDPSRKAAMQVGAAQLLGSSAGPLAASFLVTDQDIRGAVILAAGCLALSTILIASAALMGRKPRGVAGGAISARGSNVI